MVVVLILILSGLCHAQSQSVVLISQKDVNSSSYGCGAIVKVYPEQLCPEEAFKTWRKVLVLTAWHVVDAAHGKCTCTLANGEISNMSVVRGGDTVKRDIALCAAYAPDNYQALEIADQNDWPTVHAFGLAGLGFVWPKAQPRELIGDRIGKPINTGVAYYDIAVSPGDSGGPILSNNKLVGVISGGIACEKTPGSFKTWPLISARLEDIQLLMLWDLPVPPKVTSLPLK